MGEMTRTRAAMMAAGLSFFAEERGGGVYYTGACSDEQWAAIDAIAAEEAAERARIAWAAACAAGSYDNAGEFFGA